jgi:DNA-binding MarR family transcriptional regulator
MVSAGIHTPEEKLMMAVVRVAELFKRRSSCIFNHYGLSFSQYNVLRLLDVAPGGRLSITQISRRLLVSAPNMSGIAKRLERSAFVVRGSDERDDRKTILQITSAGREMIRSIHNLQDMNVREFLNCLSTEQEQEMLETLKKMLDLGDLN